jgi:hypothetical protein
VFAQRVVSLRGLQPSLSTNIEKLTVKLRKNTRLEREMLYPQKRKRKKAYQDNHNEFVFGHLIINPFGKLIRISQNTLRELDKRGYLHRDHQTGLKGMDPTQAEIFLDAEFGWPHYKEIGPKFTGPMFCVCRCKECLIRMGIIKKDDVEPNEAIISPTPKKKSAINKSTKKK